MKDEPKFPFLLMSRLLDILPELVPIDRAFASFQNEGGRTVFEWAWPSNSEGHDCAGLPFVREALEQGQPILISGHPSADGTECDDDSIGVLAEGHFLGLPIFVGGRPAGAICADCRNSGPSFSRKDLDLLTALSDSISLILRVHFGPLRDEGNGNGAGKTGFIGKSRAILHLQSLIDKIKDHDAPVFITGESGTGKELIARAIHERGVRRRGRFVAVNCGAIPDPLLESELFGHARGAFTGAVRDKAGLIEEANSGTFFLDEIGDLPLPLQAKLLRLFQEKEVRRVGETRIRRVDVRFVSATNKDVEREIEAGRFREDLFYRLKIVSIEVPPLRERKEDILPLIDHFVETYCREMKRPRAFFTPRALEFLLHYPWPGNVREVQNEIQRCLIMAGDDPLIREEHLAARINPRREASPGLSFNFFEAKADFEKRFLNQVLVRFGYNRTRTAGELGLSRQGLFKLMKKYHIDEKEF